MSWQGNSKSEGYVFHYPEFTKPERIDENKIEIEDVYCAFFGCGKKLGLVEKLCGSTCFDHMKKEVFMFHGNY